MPMLAFLTSDVALVAVLYTIVLNIITIKITKMVSPNRLRSSLPDRARMFFRVRILDAFWG